jgi:hypothetical protein
MVAFTRSRTPSPSSDLETRIEQRRRSKSREKPTLGVIIPPVPRFLESSGQGYDPIFSTDGNSDASGSFYGSEAEERDVAPLSFVAPTLAPQAIGSSQSQDPPKSIGIDVEGAANVSPRTVAGSAPA